MVLPASVGYRRELGHQCPQECPPRTPLTGLGFVPKGIALRFRNDRPAAADIARGGQFCAPKPVKGELLKPFQFDGTFHPIATGKGLRRTAVRGAGAAIAGSAGNFALQIGSVVILARLLTPSDFGIVTMVTTFSLLLRSFGLAGFTEFIMQREEITDSLASNLFWINLSIGAILTLVFAGSGRLLALFYHNPAVVPVTQGMSLTIGIGCAGYIHTGLLQRAMHFRTTAIINFVGQVLQFIISILLALAG